MGIQRGAAIILLLAALTLMVGCQTFSDRFLGDQVEDRSVPLESLHRTPDKAQPFTHPDTVTLSRGGKITLGVGFYNDLPMKAAVLVGDPETKLGFGEAQTKTTVLCEDDNGYEYTLEFDSPIMEVLPGETTAFEVRIADDHGITAKNMTCPVALMDTQSAQVVVTDKILFEIID